MAFNSQVPGSVDFTICTVCERPSTTRIAQRSCFSYHERISAVTNPLCLQQDVIYPNAIAAANQLATGGSVEGDAQLAVGCRGHQIDNEFPLESRTPFALPLVMYPLPMGVKSRRHHEFDLCACPVLNWEAYVRDIKISLCGAMPVFGAHLFGRKIKKYKPKKTEAEKEDEDDIVREEEEEESAEEVEPERNVNAEPKKRRYKARRSRKAPIKQTVTEDRIAIVNRNYTSKMTKMRNALIEMELEGGRVINPEETKEERKKRYDDIHAMLTGTAPVADENKIKTPNSVLKHEVRDQLRMKLPVVSMRKMKNLPKLKIQGTWNHIFGGLSGASCFMNTGSSNNSMKKLHVFVGKGSQLRSVKLNASSPSSMFKYTIDSVWEENPDDVPSNSRNNSDSEPLDSLIFQVIHTKTNDILGVRRGKSIDLYSTEDDVPYLLESVSNTLYGTDEYYPDSFPKKRGIEVHKDPLLLGLDFNPTYSPECITIDENWVVRICDFTRRSTSSFYSVPREPLKNLCRKDYPKFQLNQAAGVSFTNIGKLFYAWGNSVVYLGDQRSTSSSSELKPLFDLKKNLHSHALSDQNYFHTNPAFLNEYVSCVKKSCRDTYYYVGTSSKIYLMDLRVPSHPVFKISHGMQSPLTYLDSHADDNFEILVGGSQRLPETMALVTDHAHVHCYDRPACTSRNPIIHCYPRHLSNSREYFDAAVKEGHGFSMPADHNHVKSRHYAWTTGLSIWPSKSFTNPKLPQGVVVVTTNNFGDIFWQEWDQKPVPPHKKTNVEDIKYQTFTSKWKNAMSPKMISLFDKPKPSSNPRVPVDCSLMIDNLAREIERLPKIRNSPFDCFKPKQPQYEDNIKNMPSVNDLITKLRDYKGEKAEAIVDTWSDLLTRTNVPNDDECNVDEVEIKEEPQDMVWSSSSSINSIYVPDDQEEEEEEVLSPIALGKTRAVEAWNNATTRRRRRKSASSASETEQSIGECITGENDSGDLREGELLVSQASNALHSINQDSLASTSSSSTSSSMSTSDVEDKPNSMIPTQMDDKNQLFQMDVVQTEDKFLEPHGDYNQYSSPSAFLDNLLEYNNDYSHYPSELPESGNDYSQYPSSSAALTFGNFSASQDYQDSQESQFYSSGQSKRSSASYQWKKSSKGKKGGFL